MLCRKIGVTEQRYYRWKKEYRGLPLKQAKRRLLMNAKRRWLQWLGRLISAIVLPANLSVQGQEPVTLAIDSGASGYTVPPNFAGVSIFAGTQVRDHKGVPGNLFSAANKQLITLFRNAGIRHLRLGATGSATSGTQNLSHEDIDALFAFAKATDIKVIYSLHFAGGAATAKYVWDNYRPYVDCFAFDNEPDGRLGAGGSGAAAGNKKDYFIVWREFASEVLEATPGAKFAGPDAAGRSLVKRFVKEEKESGSLALVTQHTYVGGNPLKRGIDLPHAVENMLSRDWVTSNYPELYRSVLQPVQKAGLRFRITELDDHVHGVANASDAFVSALWALDCMHWWASHGADGINFQNTEWLTTDTFYRDSAGNYQIHPKAYAIEAFDLCSRGHTVPVTIENKETLNLTAYAVLDTTDLGVTIVNKEHGPGARSAKIEILAPSFNPKGTQAMFLTPPDGNLQATNGVTLGGGTITNDAAWEGKWTPLEVTPEGCSVTMPAASAAVVRMAK